MSHRDDPQMLQRALAEADASPARPLSALAKGEGGTVQRVVRRAPLDPVADRLEALGFVDGEAVKVVGAGPFGGEPMVVLVGSSRFALRHAEAGRIWLKEGGAATAAPAAFGDAA